MSCEHDSASTVHPMAGVAEGFIKGLTLEEGGDYEKTEMPETLKEMTVEEELESLVRMMNEYLRLTDNIDQTRRRIQEKLESNGNRFAKLIEHQELIKRGEYSVEADPTRGRF